MELGPRGGNPRTRRRKDGEKGIQEVSKMVYQRLRALYGENWPKDFYNEDIRLVMRMTFYCIMREALRGNTMVFDMFGKFSGHWNNYRQMGALRKIFHVGFKRSRRIARITTQEDLDDRINLLTSKIMNSKVPYPRQVRFGTTKGSKS